MTLVREAAALLSQRVEARELPGFSKDLALMKRALTLLEQHLERVRLEEKVAAKEERALTQAEDRSCLWRGALMAGETDHPSCCARACACECQTCKRAWWAQGRPVVRDGQIERRL